MIGLEGARPRAALLLRGEAFRNWGNSNANTTCCAGTETAQRAILEGHARLRAALAAPAARGGPGLEVDVFVSTYRCSNGLDLAERLLREWYAPLGLVELEVAERVREGVPAPPPPAAARRRAAAAAASAASAAAAARAARARARQACRSS